MEHPTPRAAPDYTTAAISMIAVNLLWVFFVVWWLYGIVPVLLLALFIDHLVDRFAERCGRTPLPGFLSALRPR